MLTKDVHSHLLPGIDDGVATLQESLDILARFEQMGYQKVITTPHILTDFYKNTSESIKEALKTLKYELEKTDITIEIEAAAEYYLDEHFMKLVDDRQELLTFGKNYVLFETGFMNEPLNLNDLVFKLKSNGYNPVLAHPERYSFFGRNFEMVEDLIDRGVLMQLNINSLSGYYSKDVQKMAEKLIDNNFIHFLGSDCHNMKHLEVMELSRNKRYFRKALELNLLNATL